MAYGSSQYGVLGYSMDAEDQGGTEPYVPDLLRYLPEYYRVPGGTMAVLQGAAAGEIGALRYGLNDVLDQYFVSSATWGLGRWEQELALNVDASKPAERRRKQILAKLRGTGTVTRQMLMDTAAAFSGGEVEVLEFPAEYRFVIRFIGFLGIPPNLAEFMKLLNQIKPAHVSYSFEYRYVIWETLKNYRLTWEMAKSMTWNQLKTYGGE
ncbi:putative phage tail protein [Paenibacillus sp. YN15]|uniref:putative phage tail protein n=1 Tax=Paenibacillus sp. YN15 TaxID=1742774 RepID=UPI000DCE156C|nr:putative phage tail protein [Paenibacillus sp. YN15]RAU98122.1 hypothetical protein DQG13_17675 [Paenibacillus sp. YN15]